MPLTYINPEQTVYINSVYKQCKEKIKLQYVHVYSLSLGNKKHISIYIYVYYYILYALYKVSTPILDSLLLVKIAPEKMPGMSPSRQQHPPEHWM